MHAVILHDFLVHVAQRVEGFIGKWFPAKKKKNHHQKKKRKRGQKENKTKTKLTRRGTQGHLLWCFFRFLCSSSFFKLWSIVFVTRCIIIYFYQLSSISKTTSFSRSGECSMWNVALAKTNTVGISVAQVRATVTFFFYSFLFSLSFRLQQN